MNCPFDGTEIKDGYTVCSTCGAAEMSVLSLLGKILAVPTGLWLVGVSLATIGTVWNMKAAEGVLLGVILFGIALTPFVLVLIFLRTKKWFRPIVMSR